MSSPLDSTPRTVVTFRSSAFNTTIPQKYFITPRNYGDDLANWLMTELMRRDPKADASIGQEAFGWYVRFHCGRRRYDFIVRYRKPCWVGCLKRSHGIAAMLLARFLGRSDERVGDDAAFLIRSLLSSSTADAASNSGGDGWSLFFDVEWLPQVVVGSEGENSGYPGAFRAS